MVVKALDGVLEGVTEGGTVVVTPVGSARGAV